jgi:hypothetical protein
MAHRLENVPDEIPTVYRKTLSHLTGEVLWLGEKWNQYEGLFGFSQERIDLIDEGGRFFRVILHDLLFDNVILSLSRLFDPAESFVRRKNKRSPNLSFWYLKLLLETNGESEFAKRFEEQIELLEPKIDTLKTHRNERIAHLDHSAVTSEDYRWPDVPRELIGQALQGADGLLKEFEVHFTRRAIDGWQAFSAGGYEALLTALAKARAYDRLETEGKILPNTFRNFIPGVE